MKILLRYGKYKAMIATAFAIVMQFSEVSAQSRIIPGAERTTEYFPLIKGKPIAIVANQTSTIGKVHLVDSLHRSGFNIKCVLAPEHGFRGDAEAGETVNNSKDLQTGISVVSLYGLHKKPTAEDLEGVKMVLFDVQDVGARFYTYISTLQYVMEACADLNIPVMVLDRPNPNGFYVDGPVLDTAFASFVGMNPVPVVHGLTIAEYALMLNGENWLKSKHKCELFYIKVQNWNHKMLYDLPVPPSPNLPDMSAVYLYPSLCFFEGTDLSIGRGTEYPFQVIGKPGLKKGNMKFTPKSIAGKANKPLYENVECTGYDLREFGDQYMSSAGQLYIYWLLELYHLSENKEKFFNSFFDTLAGSDMLRKQIISNTSEEEIRNSWQPGLQDFKIKRKKYLLYEDFE
jgi:uncharacterized protein YbbC (DUF1343 family)